MGGSVSLIDGHIDEIIDRCVCCGEVIPEGSMVCPVCLGKWKESENDG